MPRGFGFRKEGSYGEAAAAVALFASMQSETVQQNVNFEDVAPVRANAILASNLISQMHGGDIDILGSYDDHFALMLLGFFGSGDTSGSDPYTHVFPAVAGTTGRTGISLGIELQRDNAVLTAKYTGVKVVGFRFNASLSQSPMLGFSVIAKDIETGTPSGISVPAFNPMTIKDTTVSFDGGATQLKCQSVSITAAWPVDEPFIMGDSKFAVEPIDSDFLTVEGEATIILEDLDDFALLDGTTDIDILVKVVSGTKSIQFEMIKARFSAYAWNVTGKERLLANITWKSIFNTTAFENLKVTLVNSDMTDMDTI